jgi:5'-methylthioadenosine phosphorylase
MIGIIGGSGLYEVEGIVMKGVKKIKTPFGAPSDSYSIGKFLGMDIIFLPRHGLKHKIPPHKINYRANIWGFKKLGVKKIISFGATGGISQEMTPGTIVVPDQIIDMTSGRNSTFCSDEGDVVHIDFTEPYCPELRDSLFRAGNRSGIKVKKSGTYICTNGPRLESGAEIKFFSEIGADIVGMTAMPEAALAREAELCYAGVAVVTNYAAGIRGKKLTAAEVIAVMNKTAGRLKKLLKAVLAMAPSQRNCACKEALKEAKI